MRPEALTKDNQGAGCSRTIKAEERPPLAEVFRASLQSVLAKQLELQVQVLPDCVRISQASFPSVSLSRSAWSEDARSKRGKQKVHVCSYLLRCSCVRRYGLFLARGELCPCVLHSDVLNLSVAPTHRN